MGSGARRHGKDVEHKFQVLGSKRLGPDYFRGAVDFFIKGPDGIFHGIIPLAGENKGFMV
jgi:hypothetical protein